MAELPTGTVTFLFTDIEGSTKLWEQHPEAMLLALARHDALLRAAITTHGGQVFKTMGDAFCATFATAPGAIAAVLAAQRGLQSEPWGDLEALRVRMALHTGAAEERGGDYFGPPLNRVARLLDAGHGGQILLSQATADLIRDTLLEAATLRDLGTHRLKDLQQPEHLFQLLHPDLPGEFPPLRSLEAFAHNLPRQLTSFIGREREMSEVKRLLATTALLTLTGSGGCGKTRLALQVAADLVQEYADGVWLVELAALSDAALVPPAVAAALGVREERGRPLETTLTEYLRARSLLLVLDNCEHLLAACARLVETLLQGCPGLRILAASREGLGITGEQSYRVPSLSVPDPGEGSRVEGQGSMVTRRYAGHPPSTLDPGPSTLLEYEAVRLFVDRAILSEPGFALTAASGPEVVQICQRLDGIPLALELAAARVKALPVGKIAERLDDRFRLLTGGSRTALPRQQTLRALIDWSYDLLSEPEQMLLRRLSVFAGGWTLEAAETICAGEGMEDWEVLDLLTTLVEKSLVQYEVRDGEARYRLLETIRQYGCEKVREGDRTSGRRQDGGMSHEESVLRGRHGDWYLALAERAEPEFVGTAQKEWLDRLESEHDNLRAALEWAKASDENLAGVEGFSGGSGGLRLAAALWRFWEMRGHLSEGRRRIEQALAQASKLTADPRERAARAKALRGAGFLAYRQGDYPATRSMAEGSLALYRELGDRAGIANALNDLANVAHGQDDYALARSLYEESLALRREVGDKAGVASSLGNLGNVAYWQGDLGAARSLFEESLAIRRELGDQWGIAWSIYSLGEMAQQAGDYEQATALYQESLVLYRQLGDRRNVARSLNALGSTAWLQGDHEGAAALYHESLGISRELGSKSDVAMVLHSLGAVAFEQGNDALARSLYEESLVIRREMGARLAVSASLHALGRLAFKQEDTVRARSLYEESLAIRRELGAKPEIAGALNSLGEVARYQGQYEQAAKLYEESLALYRELGDKARIASTLGNLGYASQHLGDSRRAAALFEESLALRRDLADRRGIALCLAGLAGVAGGEAQPERAARLFGAAEALLEAAGGQWDATDRTDIDRSIAAVRSAMDADAFAKAWTEGQALSLDEAIAYTSAD